MARYTALPKIVEAVRIISVEGDEVAFDVGDGDDRWLRSALSKEIGEMGGIWVLNEGVRIGTPEGTMRAEAGDFIVKGVRGDIHSVKGDIFNATYRPLIP